MTRLFILASGPSLEGFDFKLLDNEITLGINYIFRYYTPTILLWGDTRVYYENGHKAIIDGLDCIKVTRQGSVASGAKVYKVKTGNTYHGIDGLKKGLYPDLLTGHLAISLAIALQFDPIYLLGYDCGFKDNKTHFYQDFKHKGTSLNLADTYGGQDTLGLFNTFACFRGIYNCTPKSNLKAFPSIDLDSVLRNKVQVDKEFVKQQVVEALVTR